jgi:hypothetical protein
VTSSKRLPLALRLIVAAAIILGSVLVAIKWLPAGLGGGLGAGFTVLWWFWSGGPTKKYEKSDG